jgi:hypothetical protein
MKRILSVLAAALLMQTVSLYAQQEEPSIDSVLDAARAKYWADKAQAEQEAQPSETEENERTERPDRDGVGEDRESPGISYTPVLISLVPGLSMPFGYRDASIAAGLVGNITHEVSGIEGASIFNISRSIRGIQGAGIFNIAEETAGVQASGIFNLSGKADKAIQGAGIFNLSGGTMRGVQGAGIFNIAENIRGAQGAGIFNIARHVSGLQGAGIFNSADSVTGVQIGVVNVAKHVDGIQLGLVNLAGNGVDSLAVAYEPATEYAYTYWQAGTPAFFTLVGVGAPCRDWSLDYSGSVASLGLGSRSRFLGLDLDLTLSAEQPLGKLPYGELRRDESIKNWDGWAELRPYPSIKLSASLPVGNHWRIIGGLKADIDASGLGSRVPESLKAGRAWSLECFGQDFTAWPKWFFGLSI